MPLPNSRRYTSSNIIINNYICGGRNIGTDYLSFPIQAWAGP
jgi:hypothetical protein